jgi:hypothetical protein
MKIKFNPTTEEAHFSVRPPQPARTYLPDWYKSIPAFHGKKPVFSVSGETNTTVKSCVPFADALTSGYIQESWQEIAIQLVTNEEGKEELKWFTPGAPEIMAIRSGISIPIPDHYYPIEFTFHPPWVPEMPKGWSMLYTSPFNREDLPIHVLNGIVDNDKFTASLPKSNLPFYLKKGFVGIIPIGTPLYQMIPIKREDWESEALPYDREKIHRINHPIYHSFWGGYKKLYWTKKSFK